MSDNKKIKTIKLQDISCENKLIKCLQEINKSHQCISFRKEDFSDYILKIHKESNIINIINEYGHCPTLYLDYVFYKKHKNGLIELYMTIINYSSYLHLSFEEEEKNNDFYILLQRTGFKIIN